jgi:hypothetical protein
VAQRLGGVGPGKELEAVAANCLDQPGGDGRCVGLGIGRGGQLDAAEAAALGRRDAVGRRVEARLAVALDGVGEQGLDVGQVERGGA